MEQNQSIGKFKGQPRLPKFAIPKRYELHLKPDLSACTFTGIVQICLTIVESTKFLVLNALELVVKEAWFINSNVEYHPCDIVVEGDDEILVLVFDVALNVGEGVLGIEFSGVLNEHLKGFYKCTYVDGGVKKNMAVTQFEAVKARRCFPCWDEPSLKATFKVTLTVPSELIALSNMPVMNEKLEDNVKTVCFEESPIMSTYLVAAVVGVFDHIEDTTAYGIKVGVYCPVGKSDQGKFALNVAVKSLNIYAKYFLVPYPLPKLDLVAVPEFATGAMENYGLMVYRENELLHDDSYSTASKKQLMTIITAHEVAHQWFGNLVTMEWWTHLWLNEGFATWISYMATDSLFLEWKIWTQFLEQTADGMRMDALEKSHPIEVEIHHARSRYLGDDIFQKSLNSYIRIYAGNNAKTEDLWSVLSKESRVQVNSIMDTWTKQKGYPVISVKLKDHILELQQSQFLLSGLHGDGKWIIPCNPVHCSSSSQEKNKEGSDAHLWVKLNVEQSGFYRVNYEDKLSARLQKAIENNYLSATDKFGILDDSYALCQAGKQSLSSLLALMNVYAKELDYVVLSKLIDVCYSIVKDSVDAITDSVDELKQYFINIILFSAEQLGWDQKAGESHLTELARGYVFQALTTFGHGETQKEALRRFQTLLDDKNTSLLTADTKRAAYIAVMKNTSTNDKTGLESLLKFYRETDVVQERERILRCIASSSDPNLVVEVLNFLISVEVREQDVIYGLVGISLEGREAAWIWLKENWEKILTKYGAGHLLHYFIRDIITPFSSNEKADEIEAFFANHMNRSIEMNLKLSIEQIRIKARWAQNIREEHSLSDLIKQLAHRKYQHFCCNFNYIKFLQYNITYPLFQKKEPAVPFIFCPLSL
ncbi:Aminopeptidase [Quillaja saponaria]|uniref:Aminopeptidase n=1 Tax=Quillaja saponaria TaxID=32244 RepID=A0AAD7L4R1_QUISA|nr:Aminopeptidase [Quillaja saponaria]